MVNQAITNLTAQSGALVGADLIETVDDVSGTPASTKSTLTQLLAFIDANAAFLANIVNDTTPQLGGDLDCNGNNLLEAQRPDATNAGTAITLALTDAGDYLRFTAATAVTVTVPPNSSVAFVVGTEIDFVGYGAGVVTFAAGAGVTIRSKDALLAISGQYAGVSIKKIATDEWVLIGALA